MMKKCVCTALAALLLLAGATAVPAGEVEILIDKLVEKKVLSEQDAGEILQEVREAARQERQQVVQETSDAIRKDGVGLLADLPKWVRKTTMKGDLRLRYQFNDGSRVPDRHRGRYRLRLGFVTEVTDKLQVGFGLATGGNDPRSTNQTMTNSFETPDIRLDYAYASYQPFIWLQLVGGKFKNPLWRPSDLLWDGDINPEGVSALLHCSTQSGNDLFLNTGVWVLDERSGTERDPVMFVVQPGYKLKLGKRAYVKNAVAVYSFDNVEGTVLDQSSGTNTLERFTNVLRHDYDAYALSAELGFTRPIDSIPLVATFAEYVNNYSASAADDGWLVGVKVGDTKVKKRHQWQVKAMYRRLERDAWPDIFPDSDSYDGQTNIKGYELVCQYGLLNNVVLALDYYRMRRIQGSSQTENLLQADVNFKF